MIPAKASSLCRNAGCLIAGQPAMRNTELWYSDRMTKSGTFWPEMVQTLCGRKVWRKWFCRCCQNVNVVAAVTEQAIQHAHSGSGDVRMRSRYVLHPFAAK
jgi:hypothetical protein